MQNHLLLYEKDTFLPQREKLTTFLIEICDDSKIFQNIYVFKFDVYQCCGSVSLIAGCQFLSQDD